MLSTMKVSMEFSPYVPRTLYFMKSQGAASHIYEL